MPFVKESIEMKRYQFVDDFLAKRATMAALCRQYQISRPTGYLWVERYLNGESLSDRSRAPAHIGNRTAQSVEELIIQARQKEPALGALKIKTMLENRGYTNIPSASTINTILHRNGLISREASLAATPYKRFEMPNPNIMWQSDYKGHYACGDGDRCHPLSIVDDHSRFCLNADAKTNERLEGTMKSFMRTFEIYGLPNVLLCDNGNPWGASQTTAITSFEVHLMELGILTRHIPPGRPQVQGKVERFNGSFKRERLKFHMPLDIHDADLQRQEYRDFYNNERPHHALQLDTPAQHYSPSPRRLPESISEWDYGEGCALRKIKSTGYFSYGSQGYFLSEALGYKTVAIVPSEEDGLMDITFRQFRVGVLNLHDKCIQSRKVILADKDMI